MPLQRFRYLAYVRTDAADPEQITCLPVEVTHGDRLRAELEADKQGLPVDPRKAPQQTTALWIWAALLRERLIDPVDYRTFRDGAPTIDDLPGRAPVLVHMEQEKDPETGEAAAVDVDPTSAGSASPSPSPLTSETSTAGSTPTPMSD